MGGWSSVVSIKVSRLKSCLGGIWGERPKRLWVELSVDLAKGDYLSDGIGS